MIRQCCICRQVIGEKPPYGDQSISHTYCSRCYGKEVGLPEENQYYMCYICQDSFHIDDLHNGLCFVCRSGVVPRSAILKESY